MRLFFIGSCLCGLMLAVGCAPTNVSSDAEQIQESDSNSGTENANLGGESPAELSLAEALAQVNDGSALLIDVRSDGEWDEAHFAQAQHISIDKINEDAATACAGLDKGKLVLLH